ncbi:hypothetical protein CEXT_250321 [Caerostris extrusa]|uniref:Uncharacterized protein n=1 Tax=Caerostris extrusa TaxID=172846 RepID=A0AAV4N2N3_CAEEX|nr:hypothetical protein CEXT_250321 [Caerostris extrusa]
MKGRLGVKKMLPQGGGKLRSQSWCWFSAGSDTAAVLWCWIASIKVRCCPETWETDGEWDNKCKGNRIDSQTTW